MTNPTKSVSFDDLLTNELGNFGLFQLRNVFLVGLAVILSAFKSDYIFTAAAIPHRCRITECGEDGKLHNYDPDWILNAIPETSSGFSSCQRYTPLQLGINGSLDECPALLFDHSQTAGCDGYVYSRDNTVVYDFDLGCQEWLRALPGSFSSLGILLGLPITGYISDRFGRRFALIFNVINLGIVGFIKSFSVNYTMFMVLQVLQTFLGGSIYATGFIIVAEMIGAKYRVLISAITTATFTMGQIVLGGIAASIHPWRNMIMVLYSPSLLLISYFWILPESVRWLLSKKNITEAKKVLDTAARVNKKQLSESTLATLTLLSDMSASNVKKTETGLIRRVMRSPVMLRRVCTVPIWWITTTLVYYGLSINSTSLSKNIYGNYILISAIEIPGYISAILLLDRIGRKSTISLGFIFSGLCNISFVFIPTAYATTRLILYMLSKFSISMVIISLYIFTSELYPTECRHRLLAFASMIGRIGSIAATLTPALMTYWNGLPSMIFGVLGIITGLLVLTQPETLGTKLPDTFAEAEALGKPDLKLDEKE